jgi:hypothetical protein
MTASAANTYALGHWQGPSFTSIPPTMLSPDSISPFADKLGTNYIPTEAEIKDIRGLLMEPTEKLAQIQARIDEMEAIFSWQLKAKHASLEKPSTHTRHSFHPSDTLQTMFFGKSSSPACQQRTMLSWIPPNHPFFSAAFAGIGGLLDTLHRCSGAQCIFPFHSSTTAIIVPSVKFL